MGYYTNFQGSFEFDRPLDDKLADYLKNFSLTRHVRRHVDEILKTLNNMRTDIQTVIPPINTINDLGEEGKFFAEPRHANTGIWEQFHHPSVINYNAPPSDCPSLWSDIEISEDNTRLYLKDGHNYHYIEWLEWFIKYIFEPAGYIMNGEIEFCGEDSYDRGVIRMINNIVVLDNFSTDMVKNTILQNFLHVYQEFKNNKPNIIGSTNDGTAMIIDVGDGYHVVNETVISQLYTDLRKAKEAKI